MLKFIFASLFCILSLNSSPMPLPVLPEPPGDEPFCVAADCIGGYMADGLDSLKDLQFWIELQKLLHIDPIRTSISVYVNIPLNQLIIAPCQKPDPPEVFRYTGYKGEVRAKWSVLSKEQQQYIITYRNALIYDLGIPDCYK